MVQLSESKSPSVGAGMMDLIDFPVKILRPGTDAPTRFLQIGSIFTVGTLLSLRSFFQWGNQRVKTNLYTGVIAPSGVCRKSEATSLVQRALTQATIIHRKQGNESFSMVKPSSGSIEALKEDIWKRGNGAQIYSEGGTWLARRTKNHSQDADQDYCDLYDGAPIHHATRKKEDGGSFTITDPILSLIYGTPEEPLKEFSGMSRVTSGFLPRQLFVAETRSDVREIKFPRANDLSPLEDWYRELADILERPEHHEFKFDAKTVKACEDFHDETEERYRGQGLGSFLQRGRVHCIKLAAIYAYAERREYLILREDIRRAIPWVERSLDFARTLVRDLSEDSDVTKVRQAYESLKGDTGMVDHSELLHRSKLKSFRFWPTMLSLVESGEFEFFPGKSIKWAPRLPVKGETPEQRGEKIQANADTLRQYRRKQGEDK